MKAIYFFFSAIIKTILWVFYTWENAKQKSLFSVDDYRSLQWKIANFEWFFHVWRRQRTMREREKKLAQRSGQPERIRRTESILKSAASKYRIVTFNVFQTFFSYKLHHFCRMDKIEGKLNCWNYLSFCLQRILVHWKNTWLWFIVLYLYLSVRLKMA